MELDSIKISRPWNYRDLVDPFQCKVKFTGETGEVQIDLRPEMTRKLIALLADELVEAAMEVSKMMTAEIINGAQAAIAPPAEEVADD
jgi:hypothetical protein